MSYTKQSINHLAQIYFQEYQQQCQQNPQRMLQELEHWSSADGLILGKNFNFDRWSLN